MKRISEYTGLNFIQVMQLPYSYFLMLNRESWIYTYDSSPAGREILKNLWRLKQTDADVRAVRKFQHRKEE